MSEHVAVLNLGGILLVTAPTDLGEETVVRLQEDLCARIVETCAHGVVIDITGVDVIDTFVARRLSTIAAVAKLLGARPVLVGIRPQVALTMVQLGIDLHDLRTAHDLEAGLTALRHPRHLAGSTAL